MCKRAGQIAFATGTRHFDSQQFRGRVFGTSTDLEISPRQRLGNLDLGEDEFVQVELL
jgi:hypothetical protein